MQLLGRHRLRKSIYTPELKQKNKSYIFQLHILIFQYFHLG